MSDFTEVWYHILQRMLILFHFTLEKNNINKLFILHFLQPKTLTY